MSDGLVAWLLQAAGEMPEGEAWLAPAERSTLAEMRFPRRRKEWRLGRWTAKSALAAHLNIGRPSLVLPRLEIRANEDGAPDALIDGRPLPWSVSLSHSQGLAMAAVTVRDTAVGCDLERIEPETPRYVMPYLTEREQGYLEQLPVASQPHLATLLWSAKESALKTLRTGLTLDTKAVEIEIEVPVAAAPGWQPLRVLYTQGQVSFHGWWRDYGAYVITLLTDSADAQPHRLKL